MPTATEAITLIPVFSGLVVVYLYLRYLAVKGEGLSQLQPDADESAVATSAWVAACEELDEEVQRLRRLLEALEADLHGDASVDGESLFALEHDTTVVDLEGVPSLADEVPLSIDERRAQLKAALESESRCADWEQKSPELVGIIEALKDIPEPAPALPVEPDDLKKIRGIGRVLEGVLNEKGIYTFSQLASLTLDDIEALSQDLKHFGNRVHRDRWVEQARELAHLSAE